MPLVAPTNLQLTDLRWRCRDGFDPIIPPAGQFLVGAPRPTLDSGRTLDPTLQLVGKLTWQNTEAGPHTVVVNTSGNFLPGGVTQQFLPRGSTEITNFVVATLSRSWWDPYYSRVPSISLAFALSLRQGEETSEAASLDFQFTTVNSLVWSLGQDARGLKFNSAGYLDGEFYVLPSMESVLPSPNTAYPLDLQATRSVYWEYIYNQRSVDNRGLSAGSFITGSLRIHDPLLRRVIWQAPIGLEDSQIRLPSLLIKDNTYEIEVIRFNGINAVLERYSTAPTIYQDYTDASTGQWWGGESSFGIAGPPKNDAFRTRLLLRTLSSRQFIVAPEIVELFEAGPSRPRKIAKNTVASDLIDANQRSIWNIAEVTPNNLGHIADVVYSEPVFFGTAGPVFGTAGPGDASLQVFFPNIGNYGITLFGTSLSTSQTASVQARYSVVDALPRVEISSNTSITREGIRAEIGQPISIALTSNPRMASWNAVGLPPGVSFSEGFISGAAQVAGQYVVSVTAEAADHDVSAPFVIRMTIVRSADDPQPPEVVAVPWLISQWELTDLQISVRSRRVVSTLFEDGALRIKVGDAINFAVFFLDSEGLVFPLAPESLRLTVRPANNLEDAIIFKSGTPPVSASQEGTTYYLMPVVTGASEREIALEWAEQNLKNEPVPCVADLDWVKDGKLYSSKTFPVLLELDVTRP